MAKAMTGLHRIIQNMAICSVFVTPQCWGEGVPSCATTTATYHFLIDSHYAVAVMTV